MSKSLIDFAPVPNLQGLFVADNGRNRCTAVTLGGDDLGLYNPSSKVEPWHSPTLAEAGAIRYLISPNHYHHQALVEYKDQLPKANVCATNGALPRLNKTLNIKLATLAGLKRKLPSSMQLLEPQGLKTGELWLRIEGQGGVCWVVGDAIAGPKSKKTDGFSAAPEILKPFPKFGLEIRDLFLAWLEDRLEQDQPTTVIPCHGSMLRSKQMSAKLWKLMLQGL